MGDEWVDVHVAIRIFKLTPKSGILFVILKCVIRAGDVGFRSLLAGNDELYRGINVVEELEKLSSITGGAPRM